MIYYIIMNDHPAVREKVPRKVSRQFSNKYLRRNHRIKQPGYDIQRRYN